MNLVYSVKNVLILPAVSMKSSYLTSNQTQVLRLALQAKYVHINHTREEVKFWPYLRPSGVAHLCPECPTPPAALGREEHSLLVGQKHWLCGECTDQR